MSVGEWECEGGRGVGNGGGRNDCWKWEQQGGMEWWCEVEDMEVEVGDADREVRKGSGD